jgi:hypothetical protein
MSRNRFEENDDPERYSEAQVMLPPIMEGWHYVLEKTESGRTVAKVEKDPETPERRFVVNDRNPDFYDEFGRHRVVPRKPQ